MSGRIRLVLLLSLLLGLLAVLVVQPTFWPRNWLWAWVDPLLDSDGEVIGQARIQDPSSWSVGVEPIIIDFPADDSTDYLNPLVLKFFPATFQPAGHSNQNWRYGAYLLRGGNKWWEPGLLVFVIVNIKPDNPKIVGDQPVVGIRAPDTNHFFNGRAEAVLAVSAVDPSGHNNGSFAFVVSDRSDGQVAGTETGFGKIVIVRNGWGDLTELDPNPTELDKFQHLEVIPGLTGPISVAIDDAAQEVIVVEQTDTTGGACTVGQSPLRFFSLANADSDPPYGEVRRLCIDGVGDSADIEVDRGFGRNQAFISRSFSEGKVSVINLNTLTETTVDLYPAGDPAPAPGLELDLAAGFGYLASPDLPTPGVREFNLATGAFTQDFQADVYYHLRNGKATGVQEISVANFPDGTNSVRRGMVISRSDPVNHQNRADEVTRINLNTGNTNRLGTSYHTTAVASVPQRSSDQSNQQFFLRIKVLSTDDIRSKLKKYDTGTVP